MAWHGFQRVRSWSSFRKTVLLSLLSDQISYYAVCALFAIHYQEKKQHTCLLSHMTPLCAHGPHGHHQPQPLSLIHI